MKVTEHKRDYLVPQIEVFDVKVECGFATSGNNFDDDYSDQMPEIDGENEDIEW